MIVNDPSVIAELRAHLELYEQALAGNDVAVLDSLFWDSPHAVRYGVTENLYGAKEIRRLEITSFGDSVGLVSLEYVGFADPERVGRQTQCWIRLPEGWKIASAHLSLTLGPASYLDAASQRLGLPVDASMRAGVNADLGRLGAMADFLMEFPLGKDVEQAPVFHPE
jgi:hypothetical protein